MRIFEGMIYLQVFPYPPNSYVRPAKHPFYSLTRSDLIESRRQLNEIMLAIASEFVRVEGDSQSRYVGEVRKGDRETNRRGGSGMDREEYDELELQQERPVRGETATNNCCAELNIVPDQALQEGNYFKDLVQSIKSWTDRSILPSLR